MEFFLALVSGFDYNFYCACTEHICTQEKAFWKKGMKEKNYVDIHQWIFKERG